GHRPQELGPGEVRRRPRPDAPEPAAAAPGLDHHLARGAPPARAGGRVQPGGAAAARRQLRRHRPGAAAGPLTRAAAVIGHLQGTLLHLTPERALIDVQGVGYEVHIPLSTYYEIERAGAGREGAAGAPVRLFIHTHLREDELALYGFAHERD